MKEVVYLDSNNLLIAGVVIAILIGSGMLLIPGINAPEGTEWRLNLGSDPPEEPPTPPTTEAPELNAEQSVLSMGTGYIDTEGNWVTPSAATAQSVFYGGTTTEVIDIGVHPAIAVVHSSDVTELTSIEYKIKVPKIEAKMSTDAEYVAYVLHSEYLMITVPTLPADGGSLGTTRVLEDIFGIAATSETVSGSGEVVLSSLETFLRAELAAMSFTFEPTTVDVVYVLNIQIYVQIEGMVINYGLAVGGGTYECPSIFATTIPLDIQFVIGGIPPPTPEISWLSSVDTQPYLYPVMAGYPIEFTFRPRTTSLGIGSYVIKLNGVSVDSGAWNGGDIAYSGEINVVADAPYLWECIVTTAEGQSSSATLAHRGGTTAGDVPPDGQETYIYDVMVTMSIYVPSSGISTAGIALGVIVFSFIGLVYWYKRVGVRPKKGGRRKYKKRIW